MLQDKQNTWLLSLDISHISNRVVNVKAKRTDKPYPLSGFFYPPPPTQISYVLGVFVLHLIVYRY